ncbi:MAG TPA: hypothetical protein VFQ26_06595, partial [Nitrospiraceae bacterium]|nr:hypothetical protein [Nitrospiraceae bacterium]
PRTHPRQGGPGSSEAGREAAPAYKRAPGPEGPSRPASATHAHGQGRRPDGAGAGGGISHGQ